MYIPKPVRAFAALIIALFMLTALSACADGEASVTINRNGSADMNVKLLVSSSALEQIGRSDLMSRLIDRLKADGLNAAPLQENGRTGLTVSKHMDPEDFRHNAALPKGVTMSRTSAPGFWTTKEHISVTVDPAAMMPTQASGAVAKLENLSPLLKKFALSGFNFDLKLTLPIKPDSSNADHISGNGRTLTWNIAPLQPNTFDLTVSVPNIRHIAYAGGASLIALIALVVWLIVRVRRRRRKQL
ncbi:hypothetical protein [Paenibacillus beijingensis]|uniref:DUF3153 domain-containing protein n=1 Tax=Paenibacillus beijingensis TaxID=1126833 RepID=A0A0D5NGQ0_9BACL|nr:hypothetical protein [Paenibacillus beijingensis]AJY74446.1 hypothetical protein VN24_07500 [Paenibacillus beijingensis]